ncbi:MAG: hypothetical protein ACI4AX_09360 [Muribaculaceae bacterium]
MKLPLICVITLAATCATACGGHDDTATPRRRAYQRIEAYAPEYTAVDSLPVRLLVNSSATVSRPRRDWVNVSYPRYNATIFISVTETDSGNIDDVIANRIERIALNAGDVRVDALDIDNGRFSSTLYDAPAAVAMPLQFVATDGKSLVVSASVFFDNADRITSLDSVAPAIEAIRRDLTTALDSLDYRLAND